MINRKTISTLAAVTFVLFVISALIGADHDVLWILDDVLWVALIICTLTLIVLTVTALARAAIRPRGQRSS